MSEYVILVDRNDTAWGKMEKHEVHTSGLLHRAFSIFIFNSKKELLLQQRSDNKYHSAGLWTNTCCSHPRHGEKTIDAAKRRLAEEMGISCDLDYKFNFRYSTKFSNGMVENEIDHVFFGFCNDTPDPNSLEVKNWSYMSIELLEEKISSAPDEFTEWIKICINQVKAYLSTVEINSK